jgi:hypothetical protein
MHETTSTVLGFLFPWAMTSLGSAVVFLFRGELPEKFRSAMLSLAAGIMTSASFFALLLPALQEAEEQDLSYPSWIPAFVGYALGCIFIFVLDLVIPKLVNQDDSEAAEKTERAWKLFLSVTGFTTFPKVWRAGSCLEPLVTNTWIEPRPFDRLSGLRSALVFRTCQKALQYHCPLRKWERMRARGFGSELRPESWSPFLLDFLL